MLVTPKLTVPVGFQFHQADPKQTKWRKEDERLKKAGQKKKQRRSAPAPKYPGKAEQMLELIQEFREYHPKIKVDAVLADALFGTQTFIDEASRLCGQVQVI